MELTDKNPELLKFLEQLVKTLIESETPIEGLAVAAIRGNSIDSRLYSVASCNADKYAFFKRIGSPLKPSLKTGPTVWITFLAFRL